MTSPLVGTSTSPSQADYEDVLRQAAANAKRVRELEEAIWDYTLWEPGRKGHAAAHKRLMATLKKETKR